MSVLAATSGTTYTIWLILLWFVIIPGFAMVPIIYALSQVAGERAENQAYARGERPDDADVVVTDV
ncbi:hypothetical protein [Patulibacter defluvii]|uniref:hypothetical protein n=1 Tax=Patulibacter defluvii TaxID=3095358 RepID=UPI002A752B9F|nr:hypothetical protein [Patulibacter sp. DM4]